MRSYSRAKLRYKPPPNVARPLVSDELDVESFPEEVEGLAKDTVNCASLPPCLYAAKYRAVLDCLNEFPGERGSRRPIPLLTIPTEFCDEAVNASIIAFEGDLKVRVLSLNDVVI